MIQLAAAVFFGASVERVMEAFARLRRPIIVNGVPRAGGGRAVRFRCPECGARVVAWLR